jgi:hypothetical protein
MQSTPNPKEQTVKTTLTSGYLRLITVLAVAAPLVILCGTGRWG